MWHGEVPTAEMKRMMNFTANAARQPFHVAVFTFHDVLKDATRIKMEMWIFFSPAPPPTLRPLLLFFLNVPRSASSEALSPG